MSVPAQWPPTWNAYGMPPLNTDPLGSTRAYYKVRFQSPTGNPRTVTADSNNAASGSFVVPWSDCGMFEQDTLGYSTYTLGQRYLNRVLPLIHGDPVCQSFYLRQLTTTNFHNTIHKSHLPMNAIDGPKSLGWPKTDMVEYRGEFTQRPYVLLADGTVSSASIPELKRYITKFPMTEAYHRKIAGWQFAFTAGGSTGEPCPVLSSLPEYMQRYIYTSYQWPFSYNPGLSSVPLGYIARTLGTVNNATFDTDLRLYNDDGSYTDGFPAEQLKYEDCIISQPYYGSNFQLYVDLQHIVLWNPRNWNKQLRPSSTATYPANYEYVKQLGPGNVFISPDKFSYIQRDFSKCFMPNGAV